MQDKKKIKYYLELIIYNMYSLYSHIYFFIFSYKILKF